VDLTPILSQPQAGPEIGRYCTEAQDHGLDKGLDRLTLLELCKPALERGEKVKATVAIKNFHRVAGTLTGSELTRRHGPDGLPEDTIDLTFRGSAGQSFAAFVPKGMTMRLEGDANDYFGKGLSGGKLTVVPPAGSTFVPEENVIIGNVAFYGATSGEAYIRGLAGERFCVRNSGVAAVVEGVGDHGCEYMTGGRVAVIGPTGRNFGAGMSGGVAYVLDDRGTFAEDLNREMVDPEALAPEDMDELLAMIQRHVHYTGSERAKVILAAWKDYAPKFVKVMPRDYKRMLACLKRAHDAGLSGDQAVMAAFEENAKDLSRVGGN
jgi:glutamate synthase (ferredoxin)